MVLTNSLESVPSPVSPGPFVPAWKKDFGEEEIIKKAEQNRGKVERVQEKRLFKTKGIDISPDDVMALIKQRGRERRAEADPDEPMPPETPIVRPGAARLLADTQ